MNGLNSSEKQGVKICMLNGKRTIFGGRHILKLILFLVVFCFSEQYLFSQFETVWTKTMPSLIRISAVKFSHDSKSLLCLASDWKIFIYDVQTGALTDSVPAAGQPFFSNDGSHIYGISGNRIAKYNISSKNDESVFEQSDSPISSSIMSQDEKYFLGTTIDGFNIWDVQTGKIIRTKKFIYDSELNYAEYSHIQISCDNSKIYLLEYRRYITGKDPKGNPIYYKTQRVNIYDFNSMDSIGCLSSWKTGDASGYLADYLISNTCQLVAFSYIGQVKYPIQIYGLNSMQLKSSLSADGGSYKFTSDDNYLLIANGGENFLSLWDINTGKQLLKETGTSFETLDISNNSVYISSSVAFHLILKKSSLTGVIEKQNSEETLFPNPTTGLISIIVNLPESSVLSASLTDVNGTGLGILYDNYLNHGENSLQFDMSRFPSGTYFITLKALQFNKKFKIIVIK